MKIHLINPQTTIKIKKKYIKVSVTIQPNKFLYATLLSSLNQFSVYEFRIQKFEKCVINFRYSGN